MTKSQTRTTRDAQRLIDAGLSDAAARTVSASIRAAMSNKSRAELIEWARAAGLTNHPDFII